MSAFRSAATDRDWRIDDFVMISSAAYDKLDPREKITRGVRRSGAHLVTELGWLPVDASLLNALRDLQRWVI
jgi:hypothetical protein